MKIDRFYEFVTLASTLNFRRAAGSLFITQPTLSSHIRELEEKLGAQLFERDTHSVRLTEAGQAILGESRELLEKYEHIGAVAAAAGGSWQRMNVVRLAAPLRIQSTSRRVSRLIAQLRSDGARFTVRAIDLGMQDVSELLERDACDIVLAHYAREYDMGKLCCRRLHDTPADVWVGTGNPLAGRDVVELAELGDLIYRPPVNGTDSPLTQSVLGALAERGITPTVGEPLDDQGNLGDQDFFLVFNGEEPSGTFGVGAQRVRLREVVPLSVAVTCRRDRVNHPAIRQVLEMLETDVGAE